MGEYDGTVEVVPRGAAGQQVVRQQQRVHAGGRGEVAGHFLVLIKRRTERLVLHLFLVTSDVKGIKSNFISLADCK